MVMFIYIAMSKCKECGKSISTLAKLVYLWRSNQLKPVHQSLKRKLQTKVQFNSSSDGFGNSNSLDAKGLFKLVVLVTNKLKNQQALFQKQIINLLVKVLLLQILQVGT